jgi:hypothetical protein
MKPRIDWEERFYLRLVKIARHYESSRNLLRHADGGYGLPSTEVLEYAYDNIQEEARAALRGYRRTRRAAQKVAKGKA